MKNLLVLPVLFVVLLTGCREKKTELQTVPLAVITGIHLEEVKTTQIPEMLELTGTVKARTSAVVAARIAGTITGLQVREGDRVSKGQLLARLDARETIANAASAQAAIEETSSALEEAVARRRLAEATYERYQQLYNEQAVTRQEFETKQSEMAVARQSVARADARLIQARRNSEAAGTLAGFSRIVAPISGVVVSKQASLGATIFPAQPLFTIEEAGNYQLEMPVPESLGGRLRPGDAVKVLLDPLNTSVNTKISEVILTTDPTSRTFIAKADLDIPGLKSGMFGRGQIKLPRQNTGITVPRTAVFERGAISCVWCLDNNKLARLRLVKTGRSIGDRIEVLSGLSEGDRIATEGLEKMVEGARLE